MKLHIKIKNNPYYICIDELENLDLKDFNVFILTNEKIANLHLNYLLNKINIKNYHIKMIKDGEKYKNLKTIEEILNNMFEINLDRKVILINFGGGVISDIGGFVASIYKRGIKFINIPTTLLACVDASVGGKTGINNKFGKNLIGSFYQPQSVYCDSYFLKTLDKRQLSAAMAEFIKMAISFDKKCYEFIKNINPDDLFIKKDKKLLNQIIKKSISLKSNIIIKDEKESKLRMLLNYGHTFAHVIEKLSNYRVYLHGEAVAIGINMANALALKLNILNKKEFDDIKNLLLKFDLPIKYNIKNCEKFYDLLFLDKKTYDFNINFILVDKIGNAFIKNDIKKEYIISTLKDFT